MIACFAESGRVRGVNPAVDPKLLKDPLFKELMAEGLAMQDRFAAEPVYAKTGKGFLKSAGVEELKKLKSERKKKRT
jgi:hypothetical protein